MSPYTPAQRFVQAYGSGKPAAFDELYHPDVVFHGTLAWPLLGLEALKAFAQEFHAMNPGLEVALHDEFYSADGTRSSMRFALHWHNTGPFYGKPPTGKRGVQVETHTMTLREGRIVEQMQGGNNFSLAWVEIVDLQMPWPADTPDPQPEILRVGAGGAG